MNSKKAVRRLGADNVSPPVVTTVTADQIANQLLSDGRTVEHRRPPGEHHETMVPSNNQPPTELAKPFSLDELATGLSLLKPGKTAGLDDLLTEMLQHLGNKAKSWLMDIINECTRTKHIPYVWRKAKVIAIETNRLQTWSFMCRSAPQLDSAHRKTATKEICWRVQHI